MVLNDKTYKALKWLLVIVVPAFNALYIGLGAYWSLPNPEGVVGTVSLIAAFLGTIVGISNKNYTPPGVEAVGVIDVIHDDGGPKEFHLNLNGMPEQLAEHESVTFLVHNK